MKNILILGSSGQIGSALIEYSKEKNIKFMEFDIERRIEEDLRIPKNKTLEELLEKADFVFFLAFDVGGSRYLQKYQNTYDFISNNIKILNNTFDLLKKYKSKFIFTSTQMSILSFSPYGILKRIGEEYTKTLGGLFTKFWNVYGIENDLKKSHVITDFILKAKNEKCIKLITNGKETRQFLYSRDVCEALIILAEKYDEIDRSKNLHIASGNWISILEVANIVSHYFENAPVIPGKAEDLVQRNEMIVEDPYMLKYWKPSTSLHNGIKKLIYYHNTKE